MVSLAVGKVVLPFPFSDLSQSKLRPAVVLADVGRDDWILCQVTSKPYGDVRAIVLRDDSFSEGSLQVKSFARPGKLFTANSSLILKEVGFLKEGASQQIVESLVALLRPPAARTAETATEPSRIAEADVPTGPNGEIT